MFMLRFSVALAVKIVGDTVDNPAAVIARFMWHITALLLLVGNNR